MNSALHDMELLDNMQTLYKILLETHPDNEQVQKELGKLTNNKDTYLRQIIDFETTEVPNSNLGNYFETKN